MTDITNTKSIRFFLNGIRDLLPSYFALVMATGIVSIASALNGYRGLAEILYALNWVQFSCLAILFILRLVFYRQAFLNDITDHARGAGFFTIIAGACILGNQLVLLRSDFDSAKMFLAGAAALWLILMYTFFSAVTVRRSKPSLEDGINGIWLVSVVATQAVAILGAMVADRCGDLKTLILFGSFSLFCIGTILYFLIITLIFYRLTFFKLVAEQFAPPYWINTGALAITTLSNSFLILKASEWEYLQTISPFLKASAVVFWSMGTWWMPLIVILGIWRHISGQLPLAYHPQYWGMVFPLGMYSVATLRMIEALDFQFLSAIPTVFFYLAIGAWILAFSGMIWNFGQSFMRDRQRPSSAPTSGLIS